MTTRNLSKFLQPKSDSVVKPYTHTETEIKEGAAIITSESKFHRLVNPKINPAYKGDLSINEPVALYNHKTQSWYLPAIFPCIALESEDFDSVLATANPLNMTREMYSDFISHHPVFGQEALTPFQHGLVIPVYHTSVGVLPRIKELTSEKPRAYPHLFNHFKKFVEIDYLFLYFKYLTDKYSRTENNWSLPCFKEINKLRKTALVYYRYLIKVDATTVSQKTKNSVPAPKEIPTQRLEVCYHVFPHNAKTLSSLPLKSMLAAFDALQNSNDASGAFPCFKGTMNAPIIEIANKKWDGTIIPSTNGARAIEYDCTYICKKDFPVDTDTVNNIAEFLMYHPLHTMIAEPEESSYISVLESLQDSDAIKFRSTLPSLNSAKAVTGHTFSEHTDVESADKKGVAIENYVHTLIDTHDEHFAVNALTNIYFTIYNFVKSHDIVPDVEEIFSSDKKPIEKDAYLFIGKATSNIIAMLKQSNVLSENANLFESVVRTTTDALKLPSITY